MSGKSVLGLLRGCRTWTAAAAAAVDDAAVYAPDLAAVLHRQVMESIAL
jgi:hypothetical protein